MLVQGSAGAAMPGRLCPYQGCDFHLSRGKFFLDGFVMPSFQKWDNAIQREQMTVPAVLAATTGSVGANPSVSVSGTRSSPVHIHTLSLLKSGERTFWQPCDEFPSLCVQRRAKTGETGPGRGGGEEGCPGLGQGSQRSANGQQGAKSWLVHAGAVQKVNFPPVSGSQGCSLCINK